jgi:hypothetical protein
MDKIEGTLLELLPNELLTRISDIAAQHSFTRSYKMPDGTSEMTIVCAREGLNSYSHLNTHRHTETILTLGAVRSRHDRHAPIPSSKG